MEKITRIVKSTRNQKNGPAKDRETYPIRNEGAESLPIGLPHRERYFRKCKNCKEFERQNQIRCPSKCKGKFLFDPGFLG